MTLAYPLVLLLLPPLWAAAIWAWYGRGHGLARRRRGVALALRLLIFTALVLAIAGPTWERPRQAQAVAFVGDLSASTLSGQDALVHFIDQALKHRGQDDLAALVAAGGNAVVEQPPATLTGLRRFESVVDPDYTNLEAGLSLGGALLPPGYRHRVVLLSDGLPNVGDAMGEARLLRGEGIRVDVAPVHTTPGPEVRVDAVNVPASLHVGERFPLNIVVSSTISTTSALQIFEDGKLVRSATANITPGAGSLTYQITAGSAGMHTYQVTMQPTQDTLSQNNVGSAFTTVTGPPQVLVVEGNPGAGANAAASLRADHIGVTVEQGYAVSPDLAVLGRYAAVVLADVPADELGPEVMSALQSYVGDLGHGLVALGGANSFGVGNYGNTPLETVLPVRMDLPKRKDLPTAAVVLIIESLESEANVDISKRAGEGVIDLLNPQDQVAVSDADAGLVVPLQYVTNKPAIVHAIQTMQPLDPMSYTPMLQQAYDVLRTAKAQTKHIILLGDGDAYDNYSPLLKKIKAAGIRVSTIETNASSAQDYQTMQTIAQVGGGKYYQADNISKIPQVFLTVAKTVAHSSIMEGKFYPQQDAPSPILAGITGVQDLGGYVITTPKSLATIVLSSPKSDPILAQWQYGLGRAVAWTSDSAGRWSGDWLADPATKHIWAAMVNWVLPPPQSSALTLNTGVSGTMATIGVTTSGGAYGVMSARVIGPRGAATVTLQPTAPNEYQGQFAAGTAGAYLLTVQARTPAGQMRTVSGGVVVPYPPDYRDSGTDLAALAAIAAAGGGAVLSAPAQAFAANAPPMLAPTPLQWPLLLVALVLLPLDVAARRLVLSSADWLALLAMLTRRSRGPASQPASASAPLSAMRRRRVERRHAVQARSEPSPLPAQPATPQRPAKPTSSAPTVGQTATTLTAAASQASGEKPQSRSVATVAPAQREDSAASKLLEAKRRRRSS